LPARRPGAADAARRRADRDGSRSPRLAALPVRVPARVRPVIGPTAIAHLHDRCEVHHAAAATAGVRSRHGAGREHRVRAYRFGHDAGPTGEADLAPGLIPELEAGFYQQTLFEQDWVCLANARHPRTGKTLGLKTYRSQAHVGIIHGTGYRLLDAALQAHGIGRRVLLELPGFLGLSVIVSTTDLIASLPRQNGQTLARQGGLSVHDCPVPIPTFTVKQHWLARFHHDAANRWLRGVCAALFIRPG
jgi:DNA-binding transcriptional LysR family regulator